MSIPTVFLRTNSLPSTASLTLPSPSLPPPLHLPSARHSDCSDACPLSVAQIALWRSYRLPCRFDLCPIYRHCGEKKEKKERELSISQRKSYKTLFKQWYATVDSAFGAYAINAPDRDTRMQSSATYMWIGRAGMPLVAALAYHRVPTCLGASPCKACSPPFMSISSSSVRFFECSLFCRLGLLDWMSFRSPFVDWSALAIPLHRLRATSRSAGHQDSAWAQRSGQCYFFPFFWSLRRPAVWFFVAEGLFVLFWWIGVLFPPTQSKNVTSGAYRYREGCFMSAQVGAFFVFWTDSVWIGVSTILLHVYTGQMDVFRKPVFFIEAAFRIHRRMKPNGRKV